MTVLCDECGVACANMYTVYNDNRQALIIDPCDAFMAEMHINRLSLTVKAILLTHAHYDHASALCDIEKIVPGVPSFIHIFDGPLLSDPSKNVAQLFGIPDFSAKCSVYIEDKDIITAGDFSIRVIHTPGHTPGSVCYLVGDNLFTGDTLFCSNIGRCDLYGGSYKNMSESLKKVKSLDPLLKIYPGHGPSTTLKFEIENNFFLSDDSNL